MQNGVAIVKSDNNRVQGHMLIKDMPAPILLKDPFVKGLFPEGKAPDKLPVLMFFDTVGQAFSDLKDIQADEKNPNDCAKTPHEITHAVDGTRKSSDESDLQEELGTELADMLHYIVAIAAINKIDLNDIVLRKDRAASLKYHHEINLETYLLNRQR